MLHFLRPLIVFGVGYLINKNHSRARLCDQTHLLLLHHPPSFKGRPPLYRLAAVSARFSGCLEAIVRPDHVQFQVNGRRLASAFVSLFVVADSVPSNIPAQQPASAPRMTANDACQAIHQNTIAPVFDLLCRDSIERRRRGHDLRIGVNRSLNGPGRQLQEPRCLEFLALIIAQATIRHVD
ncbi:hypothetical protein FALBO_4708 [Fusarium albosuccineum]|uniref:Uncharacterized protein n=1 Tax=Fusarium albosuccineum TaxID=1237068 RepID=A0A8H4LG40_9HYPO|nr:hypothetical protein FALBO_4708 [Fusarium albosuccineum]